MATIEMDMSDNQSQYAGTGNVRAGHEIDVSRLTKWLAGNVTGSCGPLTIEQFKGGQSNPTYKLRTPDRDFVLRRKPRGILLKGAHAIEREYRVMTALRDDPRFAFEQVMDLCGVDWPERARPAFSSRSSMSSIWAPSNTGVA